MVVKAYTTVAVTLRRDVAQETPDTYFSNDAKRPRRPWAQSSAAGALALMIVTLASIGGCGKNDVTDREAIAPSAASELPSQPSDEVTPRPPSPKSLSSTIVQPPLPGTVAELCEENKRETSRLVESYPNSPDAIEIKARVFFLLGENDAASECWERAIELNPRYAYAYCGLGQVAACRSRYDEAAARFRESLAIAPQLSEAVHGLSDCLQKLGKAEEAIDVLEKHLQVKPGSPETVALLGFTCLAAREYERAREAFEAVLGQYPTYARAQFGLATALTRLGRKEDARTAMEHHQRLQLQARRNTSDERSKVDDLQARLIDSSVTLSSVGRVYLAYGNLPEAERVVRRAVQFDSTGATCSLLSQVCAAQGDGIGAIEAMEKAVEHEPGNEQYRQILARLRRND